MAGSMDNSTISIALKALDGFPFSAQDIIQYGVSGIIRNAKNHIAAQAPEVIHSELEQVLPRLILSRCVSEFSAQGEWERFPVGARPLIQFRILGITLSGKAVITPKRIHVDLWTNNGTLSRESVLHDLSPSIYTDAPFEGSPANRDGEIRAARLFMELCVQLMGSPPSSPS